MASVAQVTYLRSKMKGKHNGYIVVIDDKLYLDSRRCFMVWDDANQMLYACKPNNDHYTQAESPMSITATAYSIIKCIEYYM